MFYELRYFRVDGHDRSRLLKVYFHTEGVMYDLFMEIQQYFQGRGEQYEVWSLKQVHLDIVELG